MLVQLADHPKQVNRLMNVNLRFFLSFFVIGDKNKEMRNKWINTAKKSIKYLKILLLAKILPSDL